MANKQLFLNNINVTLSLPITTTIETELYLAAGLGNNLPNPSGGDWFMVTVFERVGTVESNHEVMKCTARVADTLTVERAQESTSARTFLDTGITYVAMRATRGTFENLLQTTDNLASLGSAATSRTNLGISATNTPFTPAGSLAATDVQAALAELDGEKQPLDTDLSAIAGLTSAADKGIQFTGAGTAGTFDLTAAGKALLDDADATAQRVTLGLVIGTNVQAYDADLTTWAGVTPGAGVATFLATPTLANLNSAVSDADVATLAGTETLSAKTLTSAKETRTAPTISAGTLTLDLSTASIFDVALNAAITTLTISNPASSGTAHGFVLTFTADGTARAVTWPAAVKWPAATAPTLTSTNAKKDCFVFMTTDGGTSYHAFVAGQNL